jgi:O-antigen ligase
MNLMGTINKDTIIVYLRATELFSLACLLFVLPFSGMTTIKEILFFLLLLSFIVEKLLERKASDRISLPGNSLIFLIIASFLWGLIALITAIDPLYSLEEILVKMSRQYLLFFLSFFIVKEIPVSKVKWLFFSILASTALMSAYACYQFYESPFFLINRVHGFTGAFYRLSTLLVLSIPLAVTAFIFRGALNRFIFISLFVPVVFAALFFTFTRGAWIAVAVEISLLTIILSGKKVRLVFIAGLALLLVLTGLYYRSIIPQQLLSRGSEEPRIEAVKLSSEIIRKYPLTGIGYGKETFSKYYPDIYVKHAHNIFLNTAVETGLIGLALIVAILVMVLKNLMSAIRREKTYEKRLLLTGIFASFVGFMFLNLFDYMYHGWPGQMLWIFIGIGLALIRTSAQDDLKPESVS